MNPPRLLKGSLSGYPIADGVLFSTVLYALEFFAPPPNPEEGTFR